MTTSVRVSGRPRRIDDPAILEFDGAIVAEDEEDEEVDPFFVAVDSEGAEREFDIRYLDTEEFSPGRRAVVRFVETGRTRRGEQIIDVVQIWLG